MGAKAASEPWVGRPLARLEDDALLRGEGRFIDDLDPVANTRHAAVLRSPYAHARITKVDPTHALELPGVVGILTGADVAALSRPFPAGIDSPIPHYAAAHETTRYVGEPVAVVVARDRYLAEDALELIDVEYEPLEPMLDAEVAVESAACVSDRSFSYGDVDTALAGADLVVRERFRFARWSCTPVECYGVVCDWNAAEGALTAWANFQGPFTLHSVAAGALGLPGSKFRLITPPDSGGSFGIKSAVFAYVVLMGLASRKLGVPVRWIEDRLEHLAASSASSGRVTHVEAGFSSEGELVDSALRRDRGRRRIRTRAGAGHPLPHARLALAAAYRVQNVAARNRVVLTNTLPSGLNRGFGGPQLYIALERTMTIAANRLGIDPAELRRRNLSRREAFPYRTPSGALYDSGDYESCLDDALELARYEREARGGRARRAQTAASSASGSHASSSRRSRTWATSPSRSRPPRTRPAQVRQRRGLLDLDLGARRDHGAHGDDAPGPRTSHRHRPGRRGPARGRAEGRRRADRGRHLDVTLDDCIRATTRRASPASASAPSPRRPSVSRRRSLRSARTWATRAPRCAGSPARRTGTPRRCRRTDGARSRRHGVLRGAESPSAGRRRPALLPPRPTASLPTSRSSRSIATPARSGFSTT